MKVILAHSVYVVKWMLVASFIQMGGGVITDSLMSVMKNTTESITVKMNLLEATHTSTVLNHFGLMPKED